MQLRITEFGLLMATTANSAISASVTTKIAKTNNESYFITYNLSSAIIWFNETSIVRQIITLEYKIKYTETYVHRIPQELKEYNVKNWTNYQELT